MHYQISPGLAVGDTGNGVHFIQQAGVCPDGTLAENDQRAGQDIGAFNGDGYWQCLVSRAQVIIGPLDDALATMHIHGIKNALAVAFGQLVFVDG